MIDFYANDQSQINGDTRIRGFKKARTLLKDLENDLAFDSFDDQSDNSNTVSNRIQNYNQ